MASQRAKGAVIGGFVGVILGNMSLRLACLSDPSLIKLTGLLTMIGLICGALVGWLSVAQSEVNR